MKSSMLCASGFRPGTCSRCVYWTRCPPTGRPHTESGYFDYEHIPDAAAAIGKLRAYRGAYATVNPVKPELLARAWNRIRPVLKEPTTADSEVLARRWLLIDCDPKRASGVSSTKAEHESALAKARKIRSDLFSLGWPDPIMTDSGNGAQLMYRIDLPATDGGLVQTDLAHSRDDELQGRLNSRTSTPHGKTPGSAR